MVPAGKSASRKMSRHAFLSHLVTNASSGAAASVLVTVALLWSNVAGLWDLPTADHAPVTGLILLLSGVVPTFAVAGVVSAVTQRQAGDDEASP